LSLPKYLGMSFASPQYDDVFLLFSGGEFARLIVRELPFNIWLCISDLYKIEMEKGNDSAVVRLWSECKY
jgi:hypothetical protein